MGIEYWILGGAAAVFIGAVVVSVRHSRSLAGNDVGLQILPSLTPDETTAYYEPWFKPNELVEFTDSPAAETRRVGIVVQEQWAGVLIKTVDFLPGGGFHHGRTELRHRNYVRKLDRSRFDSRNYPTVQIAGWGQ